MKNVRKNKLKKTMASDHYGRLFWTRLAPKSDFGDFCGIHFMLIFGIDFVRLRQQLLGFRDYFRFHVGVIFLIFCRCCKRQLMQQFKAELVFLRMLGLRFCVTFATFSKFFCCIQDSIRVRFLCDFSRFRLPNEVPFKVSSQIFHEKCVLELGFKK